MLSPSPKPILCTSLTQINYKVLSLKANSEKTICLDELQKHIDTISKANPKITAGAAASKESPLLTDEIKSALLTVVRSTKDWMTLNQRVLLKDISATGDLKRLKEALGGGIEKGEGHTTNRVDLIIEIIDILTAQEAILELSLAPNDNPYSKTTLRSLETLKDLEEEANDEDKTVDFGFLEDLGGILWVSFTEELTPSLDDMSEEIPALLSWAAIHDQKKQEIQKKREAEIEKRLTQITQQIIKNQ